MPVQWAGLAPPLLVDVRRDTGVPLRAQLEGGLRDAIRSGRLPVGERLPSSRELARQLGLSRGLVQECYGQLQAEGYLTGVVGSGTRVAAGPAAFDPPRPATPVPAPARPRIDFASGVPDLAAFPRDDWAWAVREACRTVAVADLDYGDPRGDPRLRAVLAGYAARVRAAVTDPDRVLVCSGFAQGASLVLRTLVRAGYHRIAVENPGNGDPARSASSRAALRIGGELRHVPVDEHGVDVDALAASGAQVVVVTPAHQSPTGVVLTAERRHALVAWARATDGFVVEDDYDSEFRYDRDPVGVLQGLAPERVFTIGTVSKSLAPTIRVGWVFAPPAFAEALAEEKLLADRGTPGLDQVALALLVESGRFDRHLRRMRARYARRRTALVDALARHAPAVRLTGLAAGFHAVAHLPEGVGEEFVVTGAGRRGVGLYGMSAFRVDGATTPPQLVLGFGNLGDRAVAEGIATVADLLTP
jgi:GntR family transcriptional regulator / MocR family aminotransferase